VTETLTVTTPLPAWARGLDIDDVAGAVDRLARAALTGTHLDCVLHEPELVDTLHAAEGPVWVWTLSLDHAPHCADR
jgi:hypothetical protein